MNRIQVIALGFSLLMACKPEPKSTDEIIPVIPTPERVEVRGGVLETGMEWGLYCEETEFFPELEAAMEMFGQYAGIHLSKTEDEKEALLMVTHTDTQDDDDESYTLVINERIKLSSSSGSGCFYGMQSLLQLAHAKKREDRIVLPRLEIADRPEFSWRGMHLDVSRHFLDTAFIKKYLDILAMHKMNVFHWHLVDDPGWRIEIKKYPLLTELGAWREDRTDRPWSYDQRITNDPDKKLYGGYYTHEQIRDMVQYAKDRNITIVPEIEMPGHSTAALTAYPGYSCTGIPWTMPEDVPFEFSDPYCAGKEETYEFLEDILREVMALFPSEYIHIGGDEAKKTPWEQCPDCQALMEREGLEDVEELQSYFIQRIGGFLHEHGRKLIGWDEILEGGLAEGGLAEGAAVMSWRGEEGGLEAARSGHPAVMVPGEYLYLNSSQDISQLDPTGSGRILSLEKVYSYNPVPEELDENKRSKILGLEGCLWTEHVQTPDEACFRIFPRITAIAETGWTGKDGKDYDDFLDRLVNHYPLLSAFNCSYYVPGPDGLRDEIFYKEQHRVELSAPLPHAEIRYTLDGSEPDPGSRLYEEPIHVGETSLLKAALFLPDGSSSPVKTARYKKVSLKEPVSGPAVEEGILKRSFYMKEMISLDTLKGRKPDSTWNVRSIGIPPSVPEDHYALVWEGYLEAPEDGIYTFYLRSDDGSRLYLHGDLLIDHDGVHGATEKSAQAGLKAGKHPFRLEFFEAMYGQELELLWQFPGSDKVEPVF